MLTILGKKQSRFCDGIPRRHFLRLGALGFGGLTLADLLQLKAQGAVDQRRSSRAVIMVYLQGGPSHIDMYDLKPDAPVEFRGDFKPIQTNVPGFDICEHMPLQAKIADKLALIRSLTYQGSGVDNPHSPPELFTGVPGTKRPALGSVVSYLQKGQVRSLPPYIALDNYSYPGFVGKAHQPFAPRSGQTSWRLPTGVTAERLHDRRGLLDSFDGMRRELDNCHGSLAVWDTFGRQALDMVTSPKALEAFAVDREPPQVREKYGPGVAQDLLLARRLVEAGVPVVQVSLRANMLTSRKDLGTTGWDTHRDNFNVLRVVLPAYDQALVALATDLHERGLDQDVAVVAWGEMGRTPRVGFDGMGDATGRQHWGQAGFALLFGGGLKMGQVVGATDRIAARPATRPYTPSNVLATLYHVLGIDLSQTTIPDQTGRPVHLLDDAEKVKELV